MREMVCKNWKAERFNYPAIRRNKPAWIREGTAAVLRDFFSSISKFVKVFEVSHKSQCYEAAEEV